MPNCCRYLLALCLLTIALCIPVILSGCSNFNPISPLIQLGVYWKEGEAHKYYNTDRVTMDRAVRGMLGELQLPLQKERRDAQTIYLQAGDDDRFYIRIIEIKPNITKVSIRVNFFGDRPFAEMLYRHIDQQPQVIQFTSVQVLNASIQR